MNCPRARLVAATRISTRGMPLAELETYLRVDPSAYRPSRSSQKRFEILYQLSRTLKASLAAFRFVDGNFCLKRTTRSIHLSIHLSSPCSWRGPMQPRTVVGGSPRGRARRRSGSDARRRTHRRPGAAARQETLGVPTSPETSQPWMLSFQVASWHLARTAAFYRPSWTPGLKWPGSWGHRLAPWSARCLLRA